MLRLCIRNVKIRFYLFCLIGLLSFSEDLRAQGEIEPIYFSGFVVGPSTENEAEPIPGVHIYIPKAGRGMATNFDGFFTLPVLPGDSLILSAVGFKKHYYRIPEEKYDSYSVVIEMVQDTTLLEVIEVFPYPTEELFKEAFLALELPDEEKLQNLRRNLDERQIARIASALPMDAKSNYRYQMYRDVYFLENQTTLPSYSFLNPFAWANFFKSLKNGDFKKDKDK